MYKISVVIPTYNRYRNLELTLTGLVNQTVKPHEVIIADDGSKENTMQLVRRFQEHFPIKYYWHPDKGYRVSLTRNQGSRLISQETTHILFIDSDVVLNPKAIQHYYDIIKTHPEVVVCGKYDWLPPMKINPEDIIERFEDFKNVKLPTKKQTKKTSWVGEDPRDSASWNEKPVLGAGVLSGNLLVPKIIFLSTGGFDEKIEDRGQDGEYGRNLFYKGIKALYSDRVIGYHVSHYKDPEWETESVRRTIRYIHKKYNIPLKPEHLP